MCGLGVAAKVVPFKKKKKQALSNIAQEYSAERKKKILNPITSHVFYSK